MRAVDPLPALADDGLITPPVGSWAEEKYQLVKCYATIFATAMKSKWDCLVYIDLFAGAGRARIRESHKIVPASPLVVLEIPNPFSKYIFCELEVEKLSALEARVLSSYPHADVTFIEGDCNERVGEILSVIPKPRRDFTVLTFCFADPYNLNSLHFSTLERLSRDRFIDFLVLLPSGMDANRNVHEYTPPDSRMIANFTGSEHWRDQWTSRGSFGDFVADQFGSSMSHIGYRYEGLASLHLVRSTEKRLPLYHLGVFSKNPLGAKFWRECRKATDPQRSLFT